MKNRSSSITTSSGPMDPPRNKCAGYHCCSRVLTSSCTGTDLHPFSDRPSSVRHTPPPRQRVKRRHVGLPGQLRYHRGRFCSLSPRDLLHPLPIQCVKVPSLSRSTSGQPVGGSNGVSRTAQSIATNMDDGDNGNRGLAWLKVWARGNLSVDIEQQPPPPEASAGKLMRILVDGLSCLEHRAVVTTEVYIFVSGHYANAYSTTVKLR
ncbi:hypothetical protein B0H67DRAFT_187602 [Lasiosphaeris hirsuta]|uniref:Uncharacterized protein n=1 Tax=Lasiosphaeris hirsuta TaxID=260670 RepID=A0AA40AR16_9PEZI|nr:hypothetical protein B0H67DRAFT_187602 [Lasiosphaeris hirsuta]